MGWDQPDVYYQPEKFGLEVVAELALDDEPYSFDILVVWRHSSGLLFSAHDAGCSCPSPFENFTSLEHVDLFDYDEIEARVAEAMNDGYHNLSPMNAANFLNKVRIASKDAVKPAEVQTHIRKMIQEAIA